MNIRTLFGSLLLAGIFAVIASAGIVTISDATPHTGAAGTSAGTISSSWLTPTFTYTLSGLDLTADGGTASETVVFNVGVSSTDAGASFNPRGSSGGFSLETTANPGIWISEAGGETNFSWNAAIVSSTFTAGTVDIDFTNVYLANFGANNTSGTTDRADIVSSAGTQTAVNGMNSVLGSMVTVNNFGTGSFFGANGYDVQLTFSAVPEPSSLVLVALSTLFAMKRRRNA